MAKPQTVFDALKITRQKRKLSLEQLGVAAGLSGATVRRIEAGAQSPTLRTLDKLAGALGYDVTIRLRRKPARKGKRK